MRCQASKLHHTTVSQCQERNDHGSGKRESGGGVGNGEEVHNIRRSAAESGGRSWHEATNRTAPRTSKVATVERESGAPSLPPSPPSVRFPLPLYGSLLSSHVRSMGNPCSFSLQISPYRYNSLPYPRTRSMGVPSPPLPPSLPLQFPLSPSPSQHGGPSDIDVLDARVEPAALRHGGLEWVEVKHHQVDRLTHRQKKKKYYKKKKRL